MTNLKFSLKDLLDASSLDPAVRERLAAFTAHFSAAEDTRRSCVVDAVPVDTRQSLDTRRVSFGGAVVVS
jgi:hypothetical protein